MKWLTLCSFAILFALAGYLSPVFSCADDDPVTKKPVAEEATDEAAVKPEEETFRPMSSEEFNSLVGKKEYAEALSRLDAMLQANADDPRALSMSMVLSSMLGRDRSDQSKVMLWTIVERGRAKETWDAATAIGVSTAVDALVNRDPELSIDDKLELLDWMHEKLLSGDSRMVMARRTWMQRRVTILTSAGRHSEAAAMLDEMIEKARTDLDPSDGGSVAAFADAVSNYQSFGSQHFPERVKSLVAEAEKLTADAMKFEAVDLQTYSAFFRIRLANASALSRSDPRVALEIVNELDAVFESAGERLDAVALRSLATYGRSLASLRSRIDSAIKIEAMVGSEAPEIDAEHFVAQEPVSMKELRGKVVLIDFWAVWCGPCIATFPHLIHWHEKYADRGLVILGSTRFYGYTWDDEAGRAVSDKDATAEEELVMLENFREAYKLRHGFFTTPKGSDYQSQYGVTGIPHAVLIDQSGKISLVRIGSGEANARDIEAKIEELLDAGS